MQEGGTRSVPSAGRAVAQGRKHLARNGRPKRLVPVWLPPGGGRRAWGAPRSELGQGLRPRGRCPPRRRGHWLPPCGRLWKCHGVSRLPDTQKGSLPTGSQQIGRGAFILSPGFSPPTHPKQQPSKVRDLFIGSIHLGSRRGPRARGVLRGRLLAVRGGGFCGGLGFWGAVGVAAAVPPWTDALVEEGGSKLVFHQDASFQSLHACGRR